MLRTYICVAALLFTAACATSGVAPGDPQRGYAVWGYLGSGTTTAAVGQTVTLINAAGQPVQSATSDNFGKYVLAYHPPGSYTLVAGNISRSIYIADGDQRIDINLNSPTGEMSYAEGAAQAAQPPTCGAAAAPVGAGPGQAGPPGAPAQAAPEERDPALVGAWGRTDTLSSGDASMSTKLSLMVCGDGTYVRTVGDSVGGGAGWSGESRGADSTRGRWRTQGGVVYIEAAGGAWEPYARYYVEGGKLMFTFDNGQREVWYR